MHMKMGIMFKWFTTTLRRWKLLKKAPKVNKAKKELAYQLLFTRAPYCDVLVWRQNVPQSVKDRARGLITGIFSIYNGIICGYLKPVLTLNMASIWRLRMYVMCTIMKSVRYINLNTL